ncbi:glycosyltransferase [Zunongwangia sp. H14]|uniref:glycosyltransferase family 2 protein n=1 Tax=Zunongwangia sp. H14 TaxID=3240792 RepID=UPI0035632464
MLLNLLFIIAACYLALLLALIYGWNRITDFEPEYKAAEIKFSIIIPFRNEAENLPQLLESLKALKYPATHFEILLVNDDSEDESVEICSKYKVEEPPLDISTLETKRKSASPKKDAIQTAVQKAQFPYIITTDADCLVPELWLQTFNDFILTSNAEMICGPVSFSNTKRRKLFQVFDELDFLSLQATTVGALGIGQPFMCNGANLCYRKSTFLKAGGFSGNNNIASGDDVFLLQKFRERALETGFLKSEHAIVETKPQQNFPQLISQRMRWAAKAPAYQSVFSKFAGLSVFLMNFSLIISAFLVLFEIFPQQPVLIVFLLKFNADFILIFLAAKFFKRELVMRNYFWCSMVYPFFSTFIAIASLFISFHWKGRNFKS